MVMLNLIEGGSLGRVFHQITIIIRLFLLIIRDNVALHTKGFDEVKVHYLYFFVE
jgi:hypothetical protein